MTEEKLNFLFQEIREEKVETSLDDVSKWLTISAASVGFFGLLSHFKMPILLTKKIMIMTSLTLTLGIGITTLLMSSHPQKMSSSSQASLPKKEMEQKVTPKAESKVASIKTLTPSTITTPFVPLNQNLPTNEEIVYNVPVSNPVEESPVVEEQKMKQAHPDEQFLGDFTKIKAGGSMKIIFLQGEQASVRVENANVTPVVKNGELRLSGGGGGNGNNVVSRGGATIYVTVKTLEGLDFSGAVTAQSEDILQAQNLEIKSSGASVINLKVDAKNVDLKCSGASKIDLTGTCYDLEIKCSGSSVIDANALKSSGNGNIVVSGSSVINCSVEGNLNVATSGSSIVSYAIEPAKINVVSSGSSRVARAQ